MRWSGPATAAAGQQRLEQLRRAATPTLLATQAVLETYGGVEVTGPLVWSPPATAPAAWDGALTTVWSRSVEQHQDWSGGDDDIALSAALAAAEEDLTEHAFQPWLWRWLDVNHRICDTDDNACRVPVVRALPSALTDPDTRAHRGPAPGAGRGTAVHHPHLRRHRAAMAAAAPPAQLTLSTTAREPVEQIGWDSCQTSRGMRTRRWAGTTAYRISPAPSP